MAKWTKKDVEIIKKSIPSCEDWKFNDFVEHIAEKTERDKRSVALKITRTTELNEKRLCYRILKSGEEKKGSSQNKIISSFEVNARYRITKTDTSKWSDSWTRNCKLVGKTDRFGVFDVGCRKECFLWVDYGVDWRARRVK